MAPAIAHFLVGAGIALLFAAPIAYRYDIDRRWGLWLVPIGGLWGLLPDFHNVSPLFRSQLRALHYSPWTDLFAFHYTLDRPTVRAMYLESVFGSILFFVLTVGAFSLAQVLSGRDSTTTRERTPLVIGATITALGYAGAVVSVLVLHIGYYTVSAALLGREGLFVGWLVLAACSTLAGVGLALGFERLAPAFERPDTVGRLVTGGLGAIGGWVLASSLGPLWLRYRIGAAVGVPSFEWESALVIGVFVAVFTLVYSFVRGGSTTDRSGR